MTASFDFFNAMQKAAPRDRAAFWGLFLNSYLLMSLLYRVATGKVPPVSDGFDGVRSFKGLTRFSTAALLESGSLAMAGRFGGGTEVEWGGLGDHSDWAGSWRGVDWGELRVGAGGSGLGGRGNDPVTLLHGQ